MTQKLTEEQQRSAHKIIKANRGDCSKEGNYLNCINCPNSAYNSGVLCFTSDFPERSKSPAFQAENLRRSQAWLDAHITDAEIMAESPREFCERLVRTGMCKPLGDSCAECAKDYWATHTATPQEPPKRRPTPEEMVVGAPVRVRLWDELVRDGESHTNNAIYFQKSNISFVSDMKQFCGNTYKIIKRFNNPLRVYLEICGADFGQWKFTPEMLDYVEPVANTPTPEAKEKGDTTVKGDVDKLPHELRLINFRDLLPVDTLRIITLEGQVDDLTKKLAASKKLCDRQQRRLRANWEAKRDGEMATAEEIEAWFDAGNGSASLAGEKSKIIPKGHSSWMPATRGNLKL